jgi:hypothetical protein
MSNCRYYIVGNNDMWMIQFKDTERCGGACRQRAAACGRDQAEASPEQGCHGADNRNAEGGGSEVGGAA